MSEAQRDSSVGRRVNATVGVVVNAALLVAIHGFPGWRAAPFLAADAGQLIAVLTVALVLGMAANLVTIAVDRRAVKVVGDLVTVSVSLAVLVVAWQQFPFRLDGGPIDWELVLRVVLGVSIAGCAISIIVLLVEILRMLVGTPARAEDGR